MPINQYKGRIVSATQVTPQTYGASGEWSLNQQFQAAGSGTWPLQPLAISRSLRFNSADSAYLNRTPASTTNRRTWTFSGWVKRSALGTAQNILTAVGSSRNTYITFPTSNALTIYSSTSAGGGDGGEYISTQLFRDVSAWYHIVVAYDSTQATSTNRIKAWVNGTQITAWATATAPTLNHDTQFNWTSAPMQIGAYNTSQFQNGYFAEFNFVDGLQLDASSFGFFDLNGIWQAKTYTGTYGTNGFYLTFADNSNTTATTLGKDYSGNGNNWTPNNFSVAAGAGNDSLIDSPTNDLVNTDTGVGGEVRGNYATLNPLILNNGPVRPIDGNLKFSDGGGNWGEMLSTISMSSGKWYWETCYTTGPGLTTNAIGILPSPCFSFGTYSNGILGYQADGNKNNNGTTSAYGASYTANDVIGIALDMDAGTLTFYKNGVSQGTAFTGITGAYTSYVRSYSSTGWVNFGQRPFAYTAPSGYKALCSTNLPSPTILNGAQYFAATTYTGNGATQTITNGGSNNSLTTFAPDLVWVKSRSAATDHKLTDTVRGATKALISDTTGAETTDTTGLTAFGTTGFTLGADTNYNNNTATYVAWQWKAGGTAVTNTAGSITSSVSANTTAGFSIVTYTGTGSAATVGHGLGVAPSMVIVKERGAAGNPWITWHTSLTGGSYNVQLNTTAAQASAPTVLTATPTSTVINVGTDSSVNGSTKTYVSYCFAAVSGFSAFGSYTGNGSTDGPFVYTGFRPRYVLIKNATTGGAGYDWFVWDTSRDTYNLTYLDLNPNSAQVENTNTGDGLDVLSNGFKIRVSTGATNTNGNTFIYACFAENPFKVSRAR